MSPHHRVRVITFLSAALLLLEPAFSQGRGGATGTTGGGSAPPAGSTGTGASRGPSLNTPTNPNPGTPTNTVPQRRPTLFITGRVMLEEGTPPTDTATIERVCPGSVRAEGYTDSKGYFSIEVGDESQVFQDASEGAGYGGGGLIGGGQSSSLGPAGSALGGSRTNSMMGDQRYAACDLRARLVGYRSQTISLANRRPLDDPNIGVILLHREGRDEGSLVSAVSLAAPHDARRAFEKGEQLLKKRKTDEAAKEYQKAVAIYPKYATAWNELGRIQLEHGQNDDARKSFTAAIEADPKYVNPYLELSSISLQQKNWRELADITDRALKLDPFDYPQAFLFNGVAYYNLKNLDAAEKSIREADRLDSRHRMPDVTRLMGMILIQRRDFPKAAECLRLYLKLAPDAPDADRTREQLAQVEKLVARTNDKQDQ